jgi:hypothetical protein
MPANAASPDNRPLPFLRAVPIIALTVALTGAQTGCCAAPPPAPVAAPTPAPEPVKPEEIPDVIKIAIRFVEREHRANDLSIASAFIQSQDPIAYYIAFARTTSKPGRPRLAVVMVFKQDGWAEWEEY